MSDPARPGWPFERRLPGAFIEAALDDLPQIVARRDGKIVDYLLVGSRGVHAQTPIIQAMFHAFQCIS
jgi:hypothetical protein